MFHPAGYNRRHMARTCSSQPDSIRPVRSSSATVGPGMYSFRMRSCGGVVCTGLVVELLQDVLLRSIRYQIGIAALSFSKQPENGIFRIVYS